MDFGTLLQTANSNNGGRNGGSYYKTKFEPPKKESKNKNLSSNIQKFLAKKEEEERQKAVEAKKKRDELLAKRDTKANNKIKKMLKVIKSANKSVLDDAVDNVNTAVTMNGPDQPDEDDYGYVSREASDFYSKMMEKYKNIPDKDKFAASKKIAHSDLEHTKDRVRASFLREREEAQLPHQRKRKSNQVEPEPYEEPAKSAKVEEKPKPKRPPMPPPLDYSELIKMASKKQFEPVVIETKKPEVVDEAERPMTKKQRREYEEERAFKEARLRREKDRAAGSSGKSSPKPQSESSNKPAPKPGSSTSMRIPKLSDKTNKPNLPSSSKPTDSKDERPKIYKKEDIDAKNKTSRNTSPSVRDKILKVDDKLKMSNGKTEPQFKKSKDSPVIRSEAPKQTKPEVNSSIKKNPNNENRLKTAPSSSKLEKPDTNPFRASSAKPSIAPQKNAPIKNNTPVNNRPKTQMPLNNKQTPNTSQKPSSLPSNSKLPPQDRRPQPANAKPTKLTQELDSKGVRQFPPKDVQRPRQFPPADVRGPRQFPPRDVMLKKQKLAKRRILDDDDSEYDSSLEDFIDDGPEEGGDVSKYIKEIFGYDKSRYRGMDDDDRNMESNYSQVMREEYLSKKMGIMEDLEDMKLEAMEKQKKMQKKRKLK